MKLNIDKSLSVPVKEQLKSQIKLLIASSELSPNDPLLTVKELANSLKLNYNTVAAAYRELEKSGYLVQNRRAGTKVAAKPPAQGAAALQLSAEFAGQIAAFDLPIAEMLSLIAAQSALKAEKSNLKIAVLARTPLEASRAAHRTQALLGEQVECTALTLEAYKSLDYHLCVIDPGFVPALRASANVIPEDAFHYSTDFPAGAD